MSALEFIAKARYPRISYWRKIWRDKKSPSWWGL